MASQTAKLPDGSTLTKPAYTDSADIAVINTNMDKIVSNINAENQALSTLNSNIESMAKTVTFVRTSATTHDITVPSNSAHFLIIDTSAGSRFLYARVLSASAGSLTIDEIAKGSDVTVSKSTNTLTITLGGSATITVVDIVIRGNACS